MKIKSVGLKVSLIVALMITVIISIIFYIVSVQSDKLVEYLASNEATASNITFAKELQRLQNEALTRAEIISLSLEVINAVLKNDIAALKEALTHHGAGLDLITVCDTKGNVLMRMHHELKDDYVLNQRALSTALNTGKSISTIEKGTIAGLSTRGSAPIRDFNGIRPWKPA